MLKRRSQIWKNIVLFGQLFREFLVCKSFLSAFKKTRILCLSADWIHDLWMFMHSNVQGKSVKNLELHHVRQCGIVSLPSALFVRVVGVGKVVTKLSIVALWHRCRANEWVNINCLNMRKELNARLETCLPLPSYLG